MVEDPKDGEPVTPCMDVYKAKIQSDGSLDKQKLRIVVRSYLQNKEMVGDNWSLTASMRTLKCFLADAASTRQEFISYILLEHSCKPMLRTEFCQVGQMV